MGAMRLRYLWVLAAIAFFSCGGDGGENCGDTQTDVANCGSCGQDCNTLDGVGGVSCVAGACAIDSCATGRDDCDNNPDNGCETNATTETNCGACGKACAEPTPLCSVGINGVATCTNDCGGNTPDRCGAMCVNIDTNPDHCGACNDPCPTVSNARSVCVDQVCGFECEAGFVRCGQRCVPMGGGTFCDDGNTASGDGCSDVCQQETGFNCSGTPSVCTAICGDGVVLGSEQCDDMNTVTESCTYGQTACTVCSATCQMVAGATSYCGDSTTDMTNMEMCDDGNAMTESCTYGALSCTVCNATCQSVAGATSFCGDSATDPAQEDCDDGNATTEACSYGMTMCTVCDATCHSAAGATSYCGDGVTDATNGEACDDGNANANDGCTSCQPDPGFRCDATMVPSVCVDTCGNGIVDADTLETCDDGGTGNSDGCSSRCAVEAGSATETISCQGQPSVCTITLISPTQVNIPDNNAAGASATITSATSCSMARVNFVSFEAQHTWIGDLTFRITRPGGSAGILFDRPRSATSIPPPEGAGSGCSGNLTTVGGSYVFDDRNAATQVIADVTNSCPATISPAAFHPTATNDTTRITTLGDMTGASSGGNWVFFANDRAGIDTGFFRNVHIEYVCTRN